MKNLNTSNGPDRYADILLDNWFKRSFKEYGDAKRLMLLFLQTLIPERKIAFISYTSEESANQNPDKKGIRVDVECVDDNGERFIVEVQRAEQADFYDRAIFNSTFAIQRQLKEGTRHYGFLPVYFIGIMRFSLHSESSRYLYRYSLMEEQSHDLMTKNLNYIFLEVNKCRSASDAPIIERVGYALNHMADFTERPDGFEGEFFDLLFNSADLHTFAPEEKIKYHNDMTTERDIQNQIEFAHDKGVAEGLAKSRAETASRLKELGVDISIISKATGMSTSEVAAL